MTLQVGQRVGFAPSASGRMVTGEIVAVVPAGELPDHPFWSDATRVRPNHTASYLVRAFGGGTFWRIARRLTALDVAPTA